MEVDEARKEERDNVVTGSPHPIQSHRPVSVPQVSKNWLMFSSAPSNEASSLWWLSHGLTFFQFSVFEASALCIVAFTILRCVQSSGSEALLLEKAAEK